MVLLEVYIGLITRSKAKKKLKDIFNRLIQNIWTKVNFKETTSSINDD